MTTRHVRIAVVALLMAGGPPSAVWADAIVELEQRIARKQIEYDERLAAYNGAVETQERLRSEIEAAGVSLRLREDELKGARDKLQRIWELFLERPDVVSDSEEKVAYATAKAAHEEAYAALNVNREKLAMAEGDVPTIWTTLKGYSAELKNLTGQLANARFELLQESLSEERTVVVREETSCEELTVRACQDGTLERAKRSAVEQASAVLLASETVTEELFTTGTTAGASHVTKTMDRIRSQVRGLLIRYDVLAKGWVGETSYFYEIEAVVKGQISRDDFFEMLGVERVPRASDRSTHPTRPGAAFRDCEKCPELVVVPAGTFMMGSPSSEAGRRNREEPRHRVTIEEPFAVGIYEVTFAEWDTCVADGGCGRYRPDDRGRGRGDHPVTRVSWKDAQSYVRWLSDETGEEYRLLSEAEWEYVARAGTATPFHTGETISTDQANYNGNFVYGSGRKGMFRTKSEPVGTFPANGFGIHDVHGNVSEWVQDCWNETYVGAPADGSAWQQGVCSRRVLRGGSWFDRPGDLRSADRYGIETGYRNDGIGFRVARTLTP